MVDAMRRNLSAPARLETGLAKDYTPRIDRQLKLLGKQIEFRKVT